MIAGYAAFWSDPRFNLAKALIGVFGTVNTSIILIQMYIMYRSARESDDFPNLNDEEALFTKKLLSEPLIDKKSKKDLVH